MFFSVNVMFQKHSRFDSVTQMAEVTSSDSSVLSSEIPGLCGGKALF